MKYVEFICFLSRIAHELYKGTKQENLALHNKIDQAINPLFDAYNEHKLFTFREAAGEGGDDEEEDGDDDDAEKSGDEEEMDQP